MEQIRNKVTGMCLDTFGRKAGEKVGMADCHGLGGNQVCFLRSFFCLFQFRLLYLLLTVLDAF